MARYTGVFAAGVIVGVLITWGFTVTLERTATATVPTIKSQAADTAVPAGVAQSSFEIVSPQPAGKKVIIERIVVSRPT